MPSLPSGPGLRRLIVVTAAIAVAAAPALTGLRGNQSFAQSVPVSIPRDATVLTTAYFETEEPKVEASPSPTRSHESSRKESGKNSAKATAQPSRVESSPSATRKHSTAKPSAKPTPTASKKHSGRRPSASPTAIPEPVIEATPPATVDDKAGATPNPEPIASTPSETATPAAPVDDGGGHGGSGGGGGGGSGKGGGGHG
jgi:hypothetical protein